MHRSLSSPGLTGRPSTPRPLDLSRTPLEYWVPRFRGGRQPWLFVVLVSTAIDVRSRTLYVIANIEKTGISSGSINALWRCVHTVASSRATTVLIVATALPSPSFFPEMGTPNDGSWNCGRGVVTLPGDRKVCVISPKAGHPRFRGLPFDHPLRSWTAAPALPSASRSNPNKTFN